METPDNDPTAVALGRAVAGQFRLDRVIGRGGMGIVYHALDENLQREVAIKTLPPHLAADPQVRARFLREARTAAGLSHPNIVPIYSAAEREGVVYFVMGFVNGESLAEHIAVSGRMSPREVVNLLAELADALGFAHAHGVVHRDVKAENVLLDRRTGRAMVTDFGIARVTETKPLTATGTVLGTVHYMSPEQVAGDVIDGRSDLYSLGVLAFFALSGRFPFERSTASAVVVAHINSTPPRMREVWPDCPSVVDEIVARLLAKAPGDRYANAGELRAALAKAATEIPDTPVVGEMSLQRAEPASMRMSSTDAQQVWSRAAELQANTGMFVPPPSFTPRSSQELVTQGYDAALVKASAIDAGIDAKYVERALVERAAAAPVVIERGEAMTKRHNIFLGTSAKIEYTTAIEGELDNEAFEEVADEVRAALGEMVTVSVVGRTLTVTTGMPSSRSGGMPRYVQVHMSSRNGRTQLRAFEDLSQLAAGWFAGLGAGGGVGGSMLVGAIVGKLTGSPPLVIAAALGTVGSVLLLARFLFTRSAQQKGKELEEVLRRIVERARRSMLSRNTAKQLPRP